MKRLPLPLSSMVTVVAATYTIAFTLGGQAFAPSGLPELQAVPRYEREAFGKGWADLDGDCQDTRNEVLARDLDGAHLDADGCKVLAGTLQDPYTGHTIAFRRGKDTSDDVQIDHVVPLAYAWRGGAWRWSDEQRRAFANDETNLLAVDGPTNSDKEDAGPAEWLPPNPDSHCDYAATWTDVLRRYELAPKPEDAAILQRLTEECS